MAETASWATIRLSGNLQVAVLRVGSPRLPQRKSTSSGLSSIIKRPAPRRSRIPTSLASPHGVVQDPARNSHHRSLPEAQALEARDSQVTTAQDSRAATRVQDLQVAAVRPVAWVEAWCTISTWTRSQWPQAQASLDLQSRRPPSRLQLLSHSRSSKTTMEIRRRPSRTSPQYCLQALRSE